MTGRFHIGTKALGAAKDPPFILAEIGINHQGDVDLALAMIEAAASAGAHGVKLQSFVADRLVNPQEDAGAHALFSKVELDEDEHVRLRETAADADIAFVSTPFSPQEADMLCDLDVDAIKIASGDLTNWQLLSHVGRMQRPVILSTGMGSLAEIRWARGILQGAGCRDLIILHCVSMYPAEAKALNLLNIPMLRREIGDPVGWSDHALGNWAALTAVGLGARLVEKHFTLDKTLAGDDHACSMTPDELEALVVETRLVHQSLGSWKRQPCNAEAMNSKSMRRGLYASRDIPAGKELEYADMIPLRPLKLTQCYGADMMPRIAGRKTITPIAALSPIGPEHVEAKL